MTNSYRLTLEDNKGMETQPKDRWNVKDNGGVCENLCRLLVTSELSIDLKCLCATFDGHREGTKRRVG